jgi:hypothetical protein
MFRVSDNNWRLACGAGCFYQIALEWGTVLSRCSSLAAATVPAPAVLPIALSANPADPQTTVSVVKVRFARNVGAAINADTARRKNRLQDIQQNPTLGFMEPVQQVFSSRRQPAFFKTGNTSEENSHGRQSRYARDAVPDT